MKIEVIEVGVHHGYQHYKVRVYDSAGNYLTESEEPIAGTQSDAIGHLVSHQPRFFGITEIKLIRSK